MAKLSMGKSRTSKDPYIIISGGGWTWRVLKAYSADPDAPYARWFCDVSSPHTFGGSDMGDTYTQDIVDGARMLGARITYRDPVVLDSDLPRALRG